MDMSQYLDIFLDEGREQLTMLESNVLTLEGGECSKDVLQVIFRAAHTLKGSARAMGFLAIGDLTHEMENVLDDLRNDKISLSTDIVNALLECIDSLTVLLDTVAAAGSDQDTHGKDIPGLVARLNELRSAADTTPPPDAVAPKIRKKRAERKFEPSERELDAIFTEQREGKQILCIHVELDPGCLMQSVRAIMTMSALEPFGKVVAANPSVEKLESEEFGLSFTLLLATSSPAAEIDKTLNTISEVKSLDISPWSQDGAGDTEPDAPALELVDASEPVREPEAKAKEAAEPVKPAREAQPAASGSPAPPASQTSHVQTIRVDVTRLDKMLNLVGELVIDRTMIERLCSSLREEYPGDETVVHLIEATQRVARISGELQDEIMKTRMLPIDGVFQRMPRMVRDLAQKTGKEVDFRMFGGDTELDRSVLEVLGDPLIHLLRNSVDHGIEMPDERIAAGKSGTGLVTLSARHEENHIVIEITDDGRGIDVEKIKASAVKKGVITEAIAETMTDRDAMHLIFASGISTAKVVSDISGRGVGMDIVKSNLEKLGGRVLIDSTLGEGSRFTIHLPLTLAIVRALLVSAGGGTYVLPLGNVVEMLRLGTDEGELPRRSVGGQGMIVVRGRTIPLANLSDALSNDFGAGRFENIAEDAYVVIIGWAEKQVGLCVDHLLGEQEVVIKSLGTLLGDIKGLSGATILGDGRVALIVDAARTIECLESLTEEGVAAAR
jgi:two-component system chemotaxis sensor kinase CheA